MNNVEQYGKYSVNGKTLCFVDSSCMYVFPNMASLWIFKNKKINSLILKLPFGDSRTFSYYFSLFLHTCSSPIFCCNLNNTLWVFLLGFCVGE